MPSQSFIRRELAEVERRGVIVSRHTLRRWDGTLVDPLDLSERQKTRAVLEVGALGMLRSSLATALSRPIRFARALRLAIRFGLRAGSAGQGVFRHLIFLAEACVLLGWYREDGIDHVHAHFASNSTVAALLCHELGGPPFSFTVHGPEEFDKPLGLGLDEKIRRAAFVVAISEYGRSQLQRWVPHSEWPKIQVVHCGLDPLFLEARLAPPAPDRRLVCVARLVEQKGLLTLIEAAGRLRAEGVAFELIVAGDGVLRGEIERLIAEHDLHDQVRLVGWQSNTAVRDLIHDSRAMVLPSFAEGLPVVIMEALALGRPVISTYVAGIPELVENGVTGWLVPAGAIEPLCRAMREALDAPVDELGRMGRAGASRVAAQHNASVEAEKLVSLFRRPADPVEPSSRATEAPGATPSPAPPSRLSTSAMGEPAHRA
jgi:glycosyltransferase involved in cell wall biosynthesis